MMAPANRDSSSLADELTAIRMSRVIREMSIEAQASRQIRVLGCMSADLDLDPLTAGRLDSKAVFYARLWRRLFAF